jgi:hypothetical protein
LIELLLIENMGLHTLGVWNVILSIATGALFVFSDHNYRRARHNRENHTFVSQIPPLSRLDTLKRT